MNRMWKEEWWEKEEYGVMIVVLLVLKIGVYVNIKVVSNCIVVVVVFICQV